MPILKEIITPLEKDAINDLVPRLERILQLTKEGKITDFLCVYYNENEPSFSHSFKEKGRLRLIALMQIMLQNLISKIVIEDQ